MFTTSKHGSWLNQAEIEIGLLTRQCLGKRRLADLPRLCDEVLAWSQKPITSTSRFSGTLTASRPEKNSVMTP